jgi:hypothetical protein
MKEECISLFTDTKTFERQKENILKTERQTEREKENI